MLVCRCGTEAVGRCADDRQPVCAPHGAVRGELLLCAECVVDHDRAAAGERLRRGLARAAPTWEEFTGFLGRLRGLPHVENRVALAWLFGLRALDNWRSGPLDRSLPYAVAVDAAEWELDVFAAEALGSRVAPGGPAGPAWNAAAESFRDWTVDLPAMLDWWRAARQTDLGAPTAITFRHHGTGGLAAGWIEEGEIRAALGSLPVQGLWTAEEWVVDRVEAGWEVYLGGELFLLPDGTVVAVDRSTGAAASAPRPVEPKELRRLILDGRLLPAGYAGLAGAAEPFFRGTQERPVH